MPTKARAKMLKDTYQEKTRFKLYKKGHTWAIAGLTLLFSGVLATQQIQVTHAATTDADQSSSTTGTDTTKSASVTLATSATVATIGDQTLTVGDTAAMPSVTLAQGVVAPDWSLDDFDLSKVDTSKAGTYAVTLSAAGLAKLQAANPSQAITASNAVAGKVTVKAAATDATASTTTTQPTATTTTATPQVKTQVDAQQAITATLGNATKTYDSNTDDPATVTVTLSDGAKAPSSWYFTGTANTYQINTSTGDVAMSADGQPGTSAITLSEQGIADLQAANPDASVSAANVTAGTLTITQKSVAVGAITIADQSKAHDGDATTDPSTYNVTLPDNLTAPSTWTQNADGTYALTTTAGDIAVGDDASQQVGTYAVTLTDQALAELQAANPTFAISAKNVAAGTFTIQSLGNVTISTATISTTDTSLPATIAVSVSQGLKVPDDWVWSYKSPTDMAYAVPLTADNFDLSQVQLGTAGSYDIALSDTLKAELQSLNPDVALTDDQFSDGKVFVTAESVSSNKYTPSWLIAQVKGMNFIWGHHDVADAMVVGEPYQLQVGLYMNGVNPMYDGITEYLILPDGFSVTDAEGSSTKATDPAQVIADSINSALAVSADNGFKGVTVTQLADYKGRETFKLVLHTDGSDQAFNYSDSTIDMVNGGTAQGAFEIPIVVDSSVAGTTVMVNGSQAVPDANVVYITDDPAVTGGNYSISENSYASVDSVAAALGILNAHALNDNALGNPYNVDVVAAKVVQTYNLVTSAGTLLDTVTKKVKTASLIHRLNYYRIL